jgi:hypothetical protein
MKKGVLISGAILLCVILLITAKVLFFNSSSSDTSVLKLTTEINKSCPTMVDAETRLDKVFASVDNSVQFNYTLIHRNKDSIALDNLKNSLGPVILKKIKSSPTLSKYLNKNLTWIYSYNDKNGDFMFKITYTPEQFK